MKHLKKKKSMCMDKKKKFTRKQFYPEKKINRKFDHLIKLKMAQWKNKQTNWKEIVAR